MYTDAPQLCPSAYVVDGDTLRYGSLRLRLLGINASEPPGHFTRNRECAPGDPWTSKQSLIDAMRSGRVTYSMVTTDRYGRAGYGVVGRGEPVLLAAAAGAGDL